MNLMVIFLTEDPKINVIPFLNSKQVNIINGDLFIDFFYNEKGSNTKLSFLRLIDAVVLIGGENNNKYKK